MNNHNPARIDALLQRAGVVCAGRVHWFGEIGSTNSWLMEQRDVHGRVCIAEWQTAGRGRRGRSWRAPWGSSVLLSIGWRLGDAAAAAATGLSLVSGLAIVDALRRAGVDSVGLKWPNDLIARGQKLGGVLTELRGANCVVGMGINVTLPLVEAAAAGERIDLQSLICDRDSDRDRIDRDGLAAALIISHCRYLRRFCKGGFAQFVAEWNALNVHAGRAVSVELPAGPAAESFSGIVRGVDRHGALIVEQDGARRRIISSEASIRAAAMCGGVMEKQ